MLANDITSEEHRIAQQMYEILRHQYPGELTPQEVRQALILAKKRVVSGQTDTEIAEFLESIENGKMKQSPIVSP
jgi:hypothetical protein